MMDCCFAQLRFRRLRALFCVAVLQLGGCEKPLPPNPAPQTEPARADPVAEPSREIPREAPTVSLVFEARAEDVTEEGAYAEARRRLLASLLNDERYLKRSPLFSHLAAVVHEDDRDVYESHAVEAGQSVRIGLTHERLEAAFERLQTTAGEFDLPGLSPPLRQAVLDLHLAHLGETICQRRKDLLEQANCELAPGEPAAEVVRSLVHSIRIEPLYEGGIPVFEGKFLRPLKVRAIIQQFGRPMPLPGLPLLVDFGQGDTATTVVTDDKGIAQHLVSQEWTKGDVIRVEVDAKSLLGGQLPHLTVPRFEFSGRPIGLQGGTLIVSDDRGASREVAASVQAELSRHMSDGPELSAFDRRKIANMPARLFQKELPLLAERYAGKLDVVILLQAESEFASRMGTHRLWYEARGKVSAVNAWTGKVLSEVETVTTASGVGEDRAESAAQKALGELLARELVEKLSEL